ELGTTRSLLSRHIIDLEKALGVRLLYRDARRFAVTPVGEAVYRQAVTMCDAAQAAIAAAHEDQEAGCGPLRIDHCDALSQLISLQIAQFGKRYPGLQLNVVHNNNVDRLLRQQIDVLLQLGHKLPDSADIIARPLGRVRLVTVASPALLQELGHPSQPEAIDAHRRLGYTGHGLSAHWHIHDQLLPTRAFSSRAEHVIRAVLAGVGVAQLPLCACHDALSQGRLQRIFEDLEPEPLPLHALTITGHAPNDTVQDFIQTLSQEINNMQLPCLLATNTGVPA